MKNLRTTMLCACMLVCSAISFAQQSDVPINEPNLSKPKLFTTFPDIIRANTDKLTELLSTPIGTEVNIQIGEGFTIQGRVLSTTFVPESNISSVVVRTTNFEGARLTFTKTIIDGRTVYVGRLMSMKHGDLFELQYKNEQYIFTKKNFYDLVNE
jgi:hypothetical protein